MSASLTLAGPDHVEKVLTLVAAFQAEEGIEMSEEARLAAIMPLLEGVPHGTIYLIGPPRAPIGYIVISFGWSLEFGGLDGFIDELFIRRPVRGRGLATDALLALPRALAQAGLRALHLEVGRGNDAAQKLYLRTGFKPRENYHLMTRTF